MADIKISELEPTTDLEGLYTIGSDKNNLSKKVSLQFLKDAANYANEQGDYAKQAGDTVNGNVGVSDYPEFSASKSYVIGDIVRYNGVLYSFTANHAASAWNGSDVKATSINAITSGKLTELESNVNFNRYCLIWIKGMGGYCTIENNALKFKYLVVRNILNEDLVYLSDGTHKANEDNIIEFSPSKTFYFRKSEWKSGNAAIGAINTITLYADADMEYDADKVSLGILEADTTASKDIIVGSPINWISVNDQLSKIKDIQKSLEVQDSRLFTMSGFLLNDGLQKDNADCRLTDFIAVNENDIWYFSGWLNSELGCCIAGYDSDKKFVGILLEGGAYDQKQTIVIPSGVSFIRASSAFLTIGGKWWEGSLSQDKEIGKVVSSLLSDDKILNLEGKKVVFFGDSITAAGIYEAEFSQLSGCVAYNRGIGGTTFAKVKSSLLWNESLSDRVDLAAQEGTSASNKGLPSNPDLIYVFAGINDWGRVAKNNETPSAAEGGQYPAEQYITGSRFGDMAVEDKTTFCGGVRYVFRRLKTKYPNTPIISILPLHTYAPEKYPLWSELDYEVEGDESSAWKVQKTTDDDKSLYDFRNAIKTIANEFGIPVIDTFEMGITPILATDKNAYYNEGLHPNSTGYHLLGKFIYEKTQSIFLKK